MINHLGNPQPFVPEGTALSEHAKLGMAPGEPGTGGHGGQGDLPEALVVPRIAERRYSLSVAVYRPTIITLALVGEAEEAVCQRVQNDFPASRGEREGALGGSDGLVIHTHGV